LPALVFIKIASSPASSQTVVLRVIELDGERISFAVVVDLHFGHMHAPSLMESVG
jgi:hypothetical protein